VRNLVAVVSLTLIVSACSGGGSSSSTPGPPQAASQLVQASAEARAKCRVTADNVGYAVPCPTRVPEGLVATAGLGGCQLDIIGSGGQADCARAWRKWVVGSSETNDQHLVIVASPRALRDDAKVVNGPAWYPGARVRPLRLLRINGWQIRAVYVPFGTNAGSAFARHVVLIWTVSGHTYGVGFHKVHGLRATLELDMALARGIRLVAPVDSRAKAGAGMLRKGAAG
jgi:hypothetical protein